MRRLVTPFVVATCVIGSEACTAGMRGGRAPSDLSQFTWPPPTPTVWYLLPPGLVVNGRVDTLATVYDRLRRTLQHAGMSGFGSFAIDGTRSGFALVTRFERIHVDGKPYPGQQRFPEELIAGDRPTRLTDWLLSVIRAKPGYYRVIALLVTDKRIPSDGRRVTVEEAERWVRGGDILFVLDPRRTLRGAHCVALIYEFERPNNVDEARLRRTNMVPPERHLAAARLWTLPALMLR